MTAVRPNWEELVWGREEADFLWETFHENSKSTMADSTLTTDKIVEWMGHLKNSLSYSNFPTISLPGRDAFPRFQHSLAEAIVRRRTPPRLSPAPMTLPTLAALLHYAYGINRDNVGTYFPRPFRNVPSGGGLFPLELYFISNGWIEDIGQGLFHFNPEQNCVRRLSEEDLSPQFAACLYQPEIIQNAALTVFQTALFRRSTYKYNDRGYRFVLMEAGHVAQNLNLTATALGLGVWNVGGFRDREVDRLLGIDGVNHSTIYLHAFGRDDH